MKALVILLLVLAALVYFVFFRTPANPRSQPARRPGTEERAASKSKPQTAPSGETRKRKPGMVESVVDYGTGYTPLKVKKRSEEKINRIAEQQSRRRETD